MARNNYELRDHINELLEKDPTITIQEAVEDYYLRNPQKIEEIDDEELSEDVMVISATTTTLSLPSADEIDFTPSSTDIRVDLADLAYTARKFEDLKEHLRSICHGACISASRKCGFKVSEIRAAFNISLENKDYNREDITKYLPNGRDGHRGYTYGLDIKEFLIEMRSKYETYNDIYKQVIDKNRDMMKQAQKHYRIKPHTLAALIKCHGNRQELNKYNNVRKIISLMEDGNE